MSNKMKGGNSPFTNRKGTGLVFCPLDLSQEPITARANVIRGKRKRSRFVPPEERRAMSSAFRHRWFQRLSAEEQRGLYDIQS